MSVLCDKPSVHAAKRHSCWYCAGHIEIGEIHGVRVGTSYGDLYTMRFHPECDDWAGEHWQSEDWESHNPGDEFTRPMTAFDPSI
jgi:hypothetical protein